MYIWLVLHYMRTEPGSMNYWLWLGSALGVGFATFASAVGAIASVLKSASFSKKRGTMILLFISNFASGKLYNYYISLITTDDNLNIFICFPAISQIIAFICWIAQFYQYLTHNVLTLAERRDSAWYSTGMSQLSHSFYFVVAGILLVLINITFLCIAVRIERQERRRARHDDPAYDEKQQGAIMLY